jgi:hypothetical protein
MRALVWCAFCVVAAVQVRPVPEKLCSLEGSVVNGATGEALKGAILTLSRHGEANAGFTTVSGDKGEFGFAGIEPGRYALRAARTGFAAANYGAKGRQMGTPLALSPDRTITGIEVRLMLQAVITGRVLDGNGAPVRFSLVKLLRQENGNGGKRLARVDSREVGNSRGGIETTNDLGEFRFFGLSAGKYFISAAPPVSEDERAGRAGSANPPREGTVETYHPSTADARRAEPVEISAGGTASGIDVVLARTPMARIRGRVENLAELGASGAVAVEINSDSGALLGNGMLGPKGEFDINCKAPQGSAWFVARIQTAGAGSYITRLPLLLSGGPMDNLNLSLSPGVALRGFVRVEDGGSVPVNLRSIRLTLMPPGLEFTAPAPQVAAGGDGGFVFGKIGPDLQALTLAGVPAGVYVKSIVLGEEDVVDGVLDLRGAGDRPVQILLSGRTGQVEGSVEDAKDAPAAGVTVVLVPEDAARRELPEWHRATTTDQFGGFTLSGVRPGDYRLFAWNDVEDGAWMDPEFIKPFEETGQPIKVRAGGSETVVLKVISAR